MGDSERKARSAEEYLCKREELLKEIQSLKDQVAEQKDLAAKQVSELERKHVQDRWDTSSSACFRSQATYWYFALTMS
jgi:hypothetical protein